MDLIFLKLGGSLITDKTRPHTARPEHIARLAGEIRAALQGRPGLRLVLGHGSGSFGHVAAHKYDTRSGISTPGGWLGFAEVWREARALNQIVIASLAEAGLPVVAFPPSAGVLARHRQVVRWDLEPLRAALSAGLLPVIQGDVIFDTYLGGTILSTEELFVYLARQLQPQRILLAGLEPGVWADFPACTRLIPSITPASFNQAAGRLAGSAAVDVTGGMLAKVQAMLDLVRELPELQVYIFSGQQPGLLQAALNGEPAGTCIKS